MEKYLLQLPVSSHYQDILTLLLKFLLSLFLLAATRPASYLDFCSSSPCFWIPTCSIFTPDRTILLNSFFSSHFCSKPFEAPITLKINPNVSTQPWKSSTMRPFLTTSSSKPFQIFSIFPPFQLWVLSFSACSQPSIAQMNSYLLQESPCYNVSYNTKVDSFIFWSPSLVFTTCIAFNLYP